MGAPSLSSYDAVVHFYNDSSCSNLVSLLAEKGDFCFKTGEARSTLSPAHCSPSRIEERYFNTPDCTGPVASSAVINGLFFFSILVLSLFQLEFCFLTKKKETVLLTETTLQRLSAIPSDSFE